MTASSPTTPAAKTPGKSSGAFQFARPAGLCSVTGRVFVPQEKFMAALRETPEGLERIDIAVEAWEGYDKSGLLASWLARMPEPNEKKPLFVDDNVLVDLFERLGEATEPAKINFRFVLGLILMRKRLLVYDGTRTEGDQQFWIVHQRGRETQLQMLDPKLGEDQVRDVSGQLSQILSEEA